MELLSRNVYNKGRNGYVSLSLKNSFGMYIIKVKMRIYLNL